MTQPDGSPWNDDARKPPPVGELGRPPGWGEGPRPLVGPAYTAQRFQFGLRHIMVASVYFALVFWRTGIAVQDRQSSSVLLAGLVFSAGTLFLGLYMIQASRLMALFGWILIFLALAVSSGVTMGLLSIPAVAFALIGISSIQLQQRRRNEEMLLWSLALTTDRGLPVGEAVEALASQFIGTYRRWTFHLSEQLLQGIPLTTALCSMPRLLPRDAIFLISVGDELGQLPAALDTAARARTQSLDSGEPTGSRAVYLGIVAFQVQIILGFLMYYVVPKIEAIFKDFGTPLPYATSFALRATNFIVGTPIMAIGLSAELAFLLYLGYSQFTKGRFGVPFLDRLMVLNHTVSIYRGLGIGLRSGSGVDQILRCLSNWYPVPWVARRLEAVSRAVESGYDWTDTLRAYGLIGATDAAVLSSAERAGNLDWALGTLAELNARRLANRAKAWSRVGFALAILGLGAVVGFFGVAYFTPLVQLITRLS